MPTAFLGLGSNLGDRRANLVEAFGRLADAGLQVISVSSIYESAAVLVEDQPAFLNLVVAVRADMTPRSLLRTCLDVEKRMGRVRERRWGPRNIDIDILLFDERLVDEPGLTIPHPGMLDRGFVLVPLAEIAPETRMPSGEQVGALVASHHREQVLRAYPPPELNTARGAL